MNFDQLSHYFFWTTAVSLPRAQFDMKTKTTFLNLLPVDATEGSSNYRKEILPVKFGTQLVRTEHNFACHVREDIVTVGVWQMAMIAHFFTRWRCERYKSHCLYDCMYGIKEKLGVHAKPMVWHVSFDHGSYPGPEQCLLAWMFGNEFVVCTYSCYDYAKFCLLGCNALELGESQATFRRGVSSPSSRSTSKPSKKPA